METKTIILSSSGLKNIVPNAFKEGNVFKFILVIDKKSK